MRLRPEDIRERSLRAFLELLWHEGLHNIVVVGGAVRDLLVSRPIRDIDIAVRLPCVAPARLQQLSLPATDQGVPALWEALAPLARAIGCEVSALRNAVPFHGSSIDVLGLVPVADTVGFPFPDIFMDARGVLFNSCPELTVNQITLSPDGDVQPDGYARDLLTSTARFIAAPLPMRLRQLLRAIRTVTSLSLQVTPEAVELMLSCLARVREVNACQMELDEADTRHILEEVASAPVLRGVRADARDTIPFLQEVVTNAISTVASGE
jgi:hypothetical protein